MIDVGLRVCAQMVLDRHSHQQLVGRSLLVVAFLAWYAMLLVMHQMRVWEDGGGAGSGQMCAWVYSGGTVNKTPHKRGTAAKPLLCISHEKESIPFTPFKW